MNIIKTLNKLASSHVVKFIKSYEEYKNSTPEIMYYIVLLDKAQSLRE